MGLWNGNSNGIHENSIGHRKTFLQNQLTQVTDELNQLKLQLSTSPKDATVSFACGNFESSNSSFDCINIDGDDQSITTTMSSTTSVKTQIGCVTENDEKDRQISFLTNKLNESDKEANELRKEVERLRDIIVKQRNG